MRDQTAVRVYHTFQDWRVQLDGSLAHIDPPLLHQLLAELEKAIDHIKDELQRQTH